MRIGASYCPMKPVSRPYAGRKHVVRAWPVPQSLDGKRAVLELPRGLPTSKAIFLLYAFINRSVSLATKSLASRSALSPRCKYLEVMPCRECPSNPEIV